MPCLYQGSAVWSVIGDLARTGPEVRRSGVEVRVWSVFIYIPSGPRRCCQSLAVRRPQPGLAASELRSLPSEIAHQLGTA